MDRTRAAGLVGSFRGLKVAVLGDLMLDHFIWGTVSRISPEAPVPVVRVGRESFHLGGAGNVAANLASLGALPCPVGIAGADEAGRRALEALRALGAATEGIVEVAGRATTKKTRIVAHAQQVVRFDREEDAPLGEPFASRLRDEALRALDGAAALVVSDYEKGTISESLLKAVLPEAAKRGLPVVVDPKPAHAEWYRPVTAITPNAGEASAMARLRIKDEADARRAAAAIQEQLDCRAVLLTLGEKGILLVEKGSVPIVIPATAREVFDVTGAGDTVVAVFVLSLAAGATMREAAGLANAAAGLVVAKVGTATVTPGELVEGWGE